MEGMQSDNQGVDYFLPSSLEKVQKVCKQWLHHQTHASQKGYDNTTTNAQILVPLIRKAVMLTMQQPRS